MNFLSQDSYRGTADDSATWNLYSYCAGNPVGYVDPSGHFVVAIPFTGIVIEAVFAFVLTASVHNIDVQQRKNIEWFLNESPEAFQYATWSEIKKELGYESDSNVEGKSKSKKKASKKASLKTYNGNKEANRQARKQGFENAHKFKQSIVGIKNQSKFNIAYDKDSGQIFLIGNKNTKIKIPTDYYHKP